MPARISDEQAKSDMIEHGAFPLITYPGIMIPWPCRCLSCDAEITPRYNAIRNGDHNPCRFCSAKNRGLAQQLNEELAISIMINQGKVRPKAPYLGANAKWLCECLLCGKAVFSRFRSVQQGHLGCRSCSFGKISENQIISEDEAVQIMIEKGGVLPKVKYQGSQFPWLSECLNCEAEVTPRLHSIKKGNKGCKFCGSKARNVARKIPEEEAFLIMVEKGKVVPKVSYPGMHYPWISDCSSCGIEVSPRLHTVNRGSLGCIYCTDHGFNPKKPGNVYIIINKFLEAVKVGITQNKRNSRIKTYLRADWEVLSFRWCPKGADAKLEEARILSEWRELGYPIYLDKSDLLSTGGWTETASIEVLKEWQGLSLSRLDVPLSAW